MPKDSFADMKPAHMRVDWSKAGLTPPRKQFMAELIAEFMGTGFILLVGDSASAMTLLFTPSPYLTAYWGVCITWGLAVAMAVIATGSVSGAHLNPAVTIAVTVYRGFSVWKVIPYIIAQVLGAMVGSIMMWSMFQKIFEAAWAANNSTIDTYIPGSQAFFTQPNGNISNIDMMIGQIYQTGILLFGIFAITDQYNPNGYSHNGLKALLIGFLVAMIGGAFGFLEGWALNPARDFGPRLVAYGLGFGSLAFPGVKNTWWAPIFGPIIGGLCGGLLYECLIRPFMPGVRVHGHTPLSGLWSRIILKIAPSLRADEEEEEPQQVSNDYPAIKKAQAHADAWHLDVGPGTPQLQLGGVVGADATLDHPAKYSKGSPSTRSVYLGDRDRQVSDYNTTHGSAEYAKGPGASNV